jgi:hypothetical protein
MQSLRMGNTISLILYVGDILLAGNDVTLLQEIKRLLSQNSDTERTLMSPRGGVNRRDDQIKLFPQLT